MQTFTAFLGFSALSSGSLEETLRGIKLRGADDPSAQGSLLIFDDETGKQVDFDLRGGIAEVLRRAAPEIPRPGPGRPRLGVVPREVTLLPRHWEWLETQPNGASAALRRLIDDARRQHPALSDARAAVEATGRVMSALAGNLPEFEEAFRALYARDRERLGACVKDWPRDVQEYVLGRVDRALSPITG